MGPKDAGETVMRRLMRRASQVVALSGLVVAAAGCASVSGAAPNTAPAATITPRNSVTPSAPGSSSRESKKPTSTPTPRHTSTPRPKQTSPFGAVASYVDNSGYKVTAALYDRKTGQTFVFNPDPGVVMRTASIVKVEIMGTLFREHETDNEPVSASDDGLLTTMIENSDNSAASALWDEDGGHTAIQNFDDEIGMTGTTASLVQWIPGTTDLPGWGWTSTTAKDQLVVVKDFAFKNKWINDSYRLQGLHYMENIESDQAWGVSGGVPAGVTVALKNGWLPLDIADNSDYQINTIGWVDGDGRNYVLAVLCQGLPDYTPDGTDFASHIGALVYAAMG